MAIRHTTDTFIEKSKEIHGDKYDYSLVEYKNITTNVKIKCKKHGQFEQTPHGHIIQKSGCTKCGNSILSNNEFIDKSIKIHGNIYDYSKVNIVNNSTDIIIKCNIHGDFTQKPYRHMKGMGCKKCSQSIKLNKDSFIEKANQCHLINPT
jgi:hypothetical protein